MTDLNAIGGPGKWKIAPKKQREKVSLCTEISERNDAGLAKLKSFKGLKKAEVIDLALDLVLKMPPEEIASRIKEKEKAET